MKIIKIIFYIYYALILCGAVLSILENKGIKELTIGLISIASFSSAIWGLWSKKIYFLLTVPFIVFLKIANFFVSDNFSYNSLGAIVGMSLPLLLTYFVYKEIEKESQMK